MTDPIRWGRSGPHVRSGPSTTRALAGIALAGALILLSGCGSTARAPQAGHYAIATAGQAVTAVPTAAPGTPQLVVAGDPVRVQLPGADVVALVSGPDVTLPSPVPGQPVTAESAPGVLTVTLTATSGTLDVPAASLTALDENRRTIPLRADTDTITVSPGRPATVRLAAQFTSGDTLLTWQSDGQTLVTWDFTVEID